METFGEKVKRKTKKVFKITLITVVVLVLIAIAIAYWGVFERGFMAGKVLRISEKGYIFKTYEGKINLETFGSLKGVSPINESFDFSVESGDDSLVHSLQEVSLSGERVNLHYIKRYIALPWRGESKYFVVKVERGNP